MIWRLLDDCLSGFDRYRRWRGGVWRLTHSSGWGGWAEIWERLPDA